MATTNQVFKAKVDEAIEDCIQRIKGEHPEVWNNTPEEMWLLRVAFLDGVSFGLDKSKEVLTSN